MKKLFITKSVASLTLLAALTGTTAQVALAGDDAPVPMLISAEDQEAIPVLIMAPVEDAVVVPISAPVEGPVAVPADSPWATHWALPDLAYLVEVGLVDQALALSLDPDSPLTFTEAAQLLLAMTGAPTSAETAIATALEQGLIKPADLEGPMLSPESPVTRELFAYWTGRTIGMHVEIMPLIYLPDPFSDSSEGRHEFFHVIRTLKEVGLLQGDGAGNFHPTRAITHAEAYRVAHMMVEREAKGLDPLSATFTIEGHEIQLQDGVAEQPIAPGSASKMVTKLLEQAAGDLDGDGRKDVAVILVQEHGGSGTFYYLAGLLRDDTNGSATNAIFLGDRIQVESVTVADSQVTVAYLTHDPEQAMAESPTVQQTATFTVKQGVLEPVTAE